MGFLNLFGGDKKIDTTNVSTNTTTNQNWSDSFNSTLNQSLSKNVSNIKADSYVTNLALDSSRSYNLANVGNITGANDSGWLVDAISSFDLDKFFATTNNDPSDAIGSMNFGGAVNGISEKLKSLTGLQSATLGGLEKLTLANKSDSPTANTSKPLFLVIGLALVALVVIVLFVKRKAQ